MASTKKPNSDMAKLARKYADAILDRVRMHGADLEEEIDKTLAIFVEGTPLEFLDLIRAYAYSGNLAELTAELEKVKKDRSKLILESLIIALERDEAVLGGEIYTKQLEEARARYKEKYGCEARQQYSGV